TCGFYTLQLKTTKAGCESTCSETYSISDGNLPSFTCSFVDLNLGCNPSLNDINNALGTATATDNCGGTDNDDDDPPSFGSCIADYKGNNGGGNCPPLAGAPPTGVVTLIFTTSFSIAPTILSVTDNDPSTDLSNIFFGPGVLSHDGFQAKY